MAAYYQYDHVQKENRAVVFQKMNAALIKNLIRGTISSQDSESYNRIYDSNLFVRKSQESFWEQITVSTQILKIRDVLDRCRSEYAKLIKKENEKTTFVKEIKDITDCYPDIDDQIKTKDGQNSFGEDCAPREVQVDVEVEVNIQVSNIKLKEQETGLNQTNLKERWFEPFDQTPVKWADLVTCQSPDVQSLSSLIGETLKDENSLFSKNIYATKNYIMTGYRVQYQTPPKFSNDIRGYYRKYPFIILVIPAHNLNSMKTILLSTFDITNIVEKHLEEMAEIGAIILTPNGSPLVPRKMVLKTPDGPGLFNVKNYIEQGQRLLREEAEIYLAQIALFSGRFELLDPYRYINFFTHMKELIEKKPYEFVEFLEDGRNYFTWRKQKEYKESWLFQKFLKIKSGSIKAISTTPLESINTAIASSCLGLKCTVSEEQMDED